MLLVFPLIQQITHSAMRSFEALCDDCQSFYCIDDDSCRGRVLVTSTIGDRVCFIFSSRWQSFRRFRSHSYSSFWINAFEITLALPFEFMPLLTLSMTLTLILSFSVMFLFTFSFSLSFMITIRSRPPSRFQSCTPR